MLREWSYSFTAWREVARPIAGCRSQSPDIASSARTSAGTARRRGRRARTCISDYVADVIEVLRAEGPAVLVGHSLGGVAAWSVAQPAPELVRGAFLEDPPLYGGEPEGRANICRPALPGPAARARGTGRPRASPKPKRPRNSPRTRTPTRRPRTRWRPAPTRCCTSIRGAGHGHRRLAAGGDRRRRARERPGLRARRAALSRRSASSTRSGWVRRIRAFRSCASRAPGTRSTTSARSGMSTSRASRPSSRQLDGGPRRIVRSTSSAVAAPPAELLDVPREPGL